MLARFKSYPSTLSGGIIRLFFGSGWDGVAKSVEYGPKRIDFKKLFLGRLGHVESHFQPLTELAVHRFLVVDKIFENQGKILFEKLAEQVVAIADDQVQKGYRQQGVILFCFFQNDLGEDKSRDVLFCIGIQYTHQASFTDIVGHVAKGDVNALFRVVQAAVGIFFQYYRLFHGFPPTCLISCCLIAHHSGNARSSKE
ncbi:hypothetical protein DESC_590047 [Desulfosarcina cetonica]|nr:hypothetical protein DESC_590047 [Desulfosarcina cetonica]